MDRVGIDPKYKGGSVHMAAASAAIDRGVPIDVVLDTSRWASLQAFSKFYKRARLRAVAPSIAEHRPNFAGLAHLLAPHMTDMC